MGSIRKLLKEMDDKLWPPNKFGEELENKKNKILDKLYYCSAILCCGMISCGSILLLWPLTRPVRDTPFTCYEIYAYETHKYYWIVIYGIEVYNAIMGCIIVTAYDGVFLDFISRLLLELMLLSEGIKRLRMDETKSKIDENEKYNNIQEYVKHHDMLLR